MNDVATTQGDSGSKYGRVHWRTWSMGDNDSAPLVCLHPMPHSGDFFADIAPLLASGRTVIAPDYPGYGDSDALEQAPTIGIYAEALIEALKQNSFGPFDLFGFHTGCLVAVELSLEFPQDVGRLVLVDVPYFSAEKCQELLQTDIAKGGFVAAFSYPNEQRFAKVGHDCLVIATDSSLFEPSRQSADQIPGCQLLEQKDITAPALVNGASAIAKATSQFIDA